MTGKNRLRVRWRRAGKSFGVRYKIMSNIKEITKTLLVKYPLLTISNHTLGEPRLKGRRLDVATVLQWISQHADLMTVNDHYDVYISKEQFDQCLGFAIEFLSEVYKDNELFSEADLDEISD